MPKMEERRHYVLAVIFVCLLQTAHATSISVTTRVAGKSPTLMGINAGHANSASNWKMWLERLGVNGVRIFVTPKINLRDLVGAGFGRDLSNRVVSSQSKYATAIRQLRTKRGHDPKASWPNPVKWNEYERGLEKDKVPLLGNANNIIAELNKRGILAHVQIALSCTSVTKFKLSTFNKASSTYWQERWELYKFVYGLSRWMWIRKVKSIELYNEPNLDDGCSTSQVWLDHLRIRSAAVRHAYADLNSEVGRSSRMSVTINAPTMSSPRYGGTLGEVSVKNFHATFPSGSSKSWKNFDRYTFHVAGGQGYYAAYNYRSLSASIHKTLRGLPVDVTEYNTLAGSSFEKTKQTMDTPQQSADFGDIAAYLLPLASRSFVFKFSQTPKSGGSGIQKNGLLSGENSIAPFNIGDSSRTFEVYQAIIEHCLGGQRLYAVNLPALKASRLSAWGVQVGPNWYLYLINDYSSARSFSISLSAWGVPSGVPVIINEISARYVNQVAAITTLGSSKKISYTQPAFAVSVLTIPRLRPRTATCIAVADAQVLAGNNQKRNYGGLRTLNVKTSSTSNHDGTAVSFVQFDTGVSPSKVSSAILQLYVAGSGSKTSTLLVLGVSSSWREGSITWANAPNLRSLSNGRTINKIAYNPIDYNPQPKVAGHITVPAKFKGTVRVDVTNFIKRAGGQKVSFQLSRIVRFNANKQLPGDSLAGNSVTFASRQAASGQRPRLVLYYT